MPLQRSRTNRKIAGVCGGIADWLGWDPTVVRILYVLVSVLSAAFPGILVYLLLSLLINIMPGGKRPGTQAQVLGVFAGALKAFVAAMALVGVLLASPLSEAFTKDIERSPIVRPVAASQRGSIRQLRSMSPIPFPPVGPDHKF